jgi:dipeptide/tripeptide permease
MSTSDADRQKSQPRTPFPKPFYVANLMEIFERFAWYGFFTVSSLYLTTPIAQGGLGFTEQQRGTLQGVVPFFLYLLPVITGALGDRYGYRRMFILSFLIMSPSYFLLGQARSFAGFFVVFLFVCSRFWSASSSNVGGCSTCWSAAPFWSASGTSPPAGRTASPWGGSPP